MFMSFLNTLPSGILVLLGFAILGLCNYLKTLYTCRVKIKLFHDYRSVLAEFHNDVRDGRDVDVELTDYLLEHATEIFLDSIVYIRTHNPVSGISTGTLNMINDIVTGKCHDFTGTCKDLENMLTQNIGVFKNISKKTRSKLISPLSLVKNGVLLIFNIIPIVNLTPRKIKDFLSALFAWVSIANTLLSFLLKKPILLSIVRQIRAWISQI